MSISKRTRFEVFKRDGFACQYCGQHPPAVLLEVDHINPKSAGGPDDFNNLITACRDCNSGKSNISLKRIPEKLKTDIVTLREKEEQLREYNKALRAVRQREEKDIEAVASVYTLYFNNYVLTASFKNTTILRFIRALPTIEVAEAMESACSFMTDRNRSHGEDQAVRYFCGICWKKIRGDRG